MNAGLGEAQRAALDEKVAALAEERDHAIDSILEIFASQGGDPHLLKSIAYAAFMRGCWSGAAQQSTTICALQDKDKAECLAAIGASRASRPSSGDRE